MLVVKVKVGQATGREIKLKSGVIKKVAEQVGFIEANDEVRKVRLPIDVESGQKPYEPGLYVLAPSSFEVSKYGDLTVNPYELCLLPLASVSELLRQSKAA